MVAKKQYLIGIDIGTQGTKAALFDRRGRTCATAFCKSRLHQPAAGVVEEDPQQQVKSVCQCIRKCMADSGVDPLEIAALGIDGQMAGILGIGPDGRHVTPYDSWLDTRCGPYIKVMQKEAGREIIRKTGGPVSFNHGPKILWWKHQQPDVYQQIAAFVQPGGYAAMQLCGLDASQAFLDASYLHFSGFADNRRLQWDRKLCQRFEIDMSKLPRIVDSSQVIGEVTGRMAGRCGLQAGVPVIAGCGDTAASFLACGATREGLCVDVAGTASVFAATTQQFKADTKFNVLAWGRSATPGLWHPYAYINGGGLNLTWFAEQIAGTGRTASAQSLEQLGKLAGQIKPQASDPLFVPHLGGRNSPAYPDLRGCWAGLTWNHTAGHLYRAVLEGVALEYRIYLQTLRALNPELEIREIRVTGGGEKSTLWNAIKADALGVPVVQLTRPEGAPMGVAMLAGYGVGMFSQLDRTARQWIKTGSVARPADQHAAHYAERAARYERLLELMQDWSLI